MDAHMNVHMVFGSMWLLRAEHMANKQHSLCLDRFMMGEMAVYSRALLTGAS